MAESTEEPASLTGGEVYASQPVPIVSGPSEVSAVVDVSQHTDPTQLMRIELVHSYDDGQTWVIEASAERIGGVMAVDVRGQPATVTTASVGAKFSESADGVIFTPRHLPPFQARVTLEINQGTLDTATQIRAD